MTIFEFLPTLFFSYFLPNLPLDIPVSRVGMPQAIGLTFSWPKKCLAAQLVYVQREKESRNLKIWLQANSPGLSIRHYFVAAGEAYYLLRIVPVFELLTTLKFFDRQKCTAYAWDSQYPVHEAVSDKNTAICTGTGCL
jgi:hypothetical protein